jgi:4-amino-4-deoxy-L-arabinose transferase-like glycosyltransferase
MTEQTDSPNPLPATRHNGWPAALCVVAVILAGYWLITTRSTLWDRDEPRFAAAAVEMVQSGNYLFPTFNGELRPHKPIMIYWLMSLPVRLMGPTELAVRFFAPIGMAISALLTYWIGRRMFNRRVAIVAMVMLVTTPMTLMVGTAATSDGVLLATMMGAFAAMAWHFTGGGVVGPALLMAVSLGAAQLTKGPVGLAVPLLAAASMAWMGRGGVLVKAKPFAGVCLFAALVSTAMFLAWAIPANNATGGAFAERGLGDQLWHRLFTPMESHGGGLLISLPYYVPVVIGMFVPWTLHLPGALSATLGGRIGAGRGKALLFGWIIPTFVLMSLVATKLPHYVLAMWPAMALMCAATLDEVARGTLTDRDHKWLRWGRVFFGIPAGGVALGLMIGPWFVDAQPLRMPGMIAGGVLLVAVVVACRLQRAGRFFDASKVALGGVILFMLLAAWVVMPAIERFKPAPVVARAIRAQTSDDVPVYTLGFGEPSLVFYVRRPPLVALGSSEALHAWVSEPGPAVLVTRRRYLDAYEREHGPAPLTVIATGKGLNYAKGDALDLIALGRNLEQSP